jgi:hypothetical protein
MAQISRIKDRRVNDVLGTVGEGNRQRGPKRDSYVCEICAICGSFPFRDKNFAGGSLSLILIAALRKETSPRLSTPV